MTVEITTLKNGIRVVTDTLKEVESASLGIWVKAGTRNETAANNGVAHFLEHMAFKGTEKRSAQDIAEAIENVGGYLNAYTSREVTAYYARVLKNDSNLALDVLTDILQNSLFQETEMQKEREVILQEIGQSIDTPDDIIFDYFQEMAFPDQPMGYSILGPADNIKTMPATTLKKFMDDHYHGPRMVVSASGNVSHKEICAAAEKLSPNHAKPPVKNTPVSYKGTKKIFHRDLEQAHILMGFEGVSSQDDQYYTASLASIILGGGMSSRLFQEIREKRGLVYSIYTFSSVYSDAGLFGLYAGTSPDDAQQLYDVTLAELDKAQHTITSEELERAKAQIKSSLLMGLESSSSRAKRNAQNLLIHNRIIGIEEIKEKINAVTPQHIEMFIKKLLQSPMTLTALGNENKLNTLL